MVEGYLFKCYEFSYFWERVHELSAAALENGSCCNHGASLVGLQIADVEIVIWVSD